MKIEKKKWQKDIIEQYRTISNEDLLDEIFSQASGDDGENGWDGYFTDRGQWEYNYLISLLRERLADWLKE